MNDGHKRDGSCANVHIHKSARWCVCPLLNNIAGLISDRELSKIIGLCKWQLKKPEVATCAHALKLCVRGRRGAAVA